MAKKTGVLTVAQLIEKAIDESDKTQKEIAEELGYENPNIITMFKQGHTKVPLRTIGPLARAIGIDPAYFVRVAMKEYMPETWAVLNELAGSMFITENEKKLIRAYREVSGGKDYPAIVIPNTISVMTDEVSG